MTTIQVQAGTSAARLQAIIDTAAEGTHIVLQEGNYRFTQTVEIDRNGITLEGQGSVTIVADKCLNGEPALQIGASLYCEKVGAPAKLATAVSEGAKSISLQAGHGVAVGDVIWVEQPNDAALFAQIGNTQWHEDKPLRTALATVTAVNGTTVSLDRSLPFDFAANKTTVEVTHMVHDVTVKGITFRGDFGASTASDFNNTLATESGGTMLVVNASVGTHLADINIVEPGSNGLVLGRSLDAVVTNVSVTGAHNKGDGGNGYAFWLRDITDCTFTDLSAVDTRHAVLFASYTSATGNQVNVAFTNRDINFHGGLDHGNTVTVDNSIRNTAEQGYMGGVSFVNPGTAYGAPTDAGANTITFKNVVGTVRADVVVAHNSGAIISTLGGNDTLTGGDGNDLLNAGTGNDLINASRGHDVVIGGAGSDTFVFGFERDQAFVQTVGLTTFVTTAQGVSALTEVEMLNFSSGNTTIAAAETAILHGQEGYDRLDIARTLIADDLIDAVTMIGTGNFGFMGNALANNIIGNGGHNQLLGQGGDDRIFGRAGNDYIDGGTGNDYLNGGAGKDTLLGGLGDDTMVGRQGADVFVASEGRNIVEDFSIAQGDMLAFRGHSAADLLLSVANYLHGCLTAGDDFSISSETVNGKPTLIIMSDLGDSLSLQNVSATDLHSYLLA